MSLLAKFEEAAEHLFTGMFKKNCARLQPVELAKELVKVMLKNKQISISQVYVPNVYRVFLHSNDWSSFASFGNIFLVELSKYLYAEGQKNSFTFLSKPSIELHSDDTVNPREMSIEVDFDESIEVFWDEESEDEGYLDLGSQVEKDVEDWREQTSIFQGQLPLSSNTGEGIDRVKSQVLEIIEGPDLGQVFTLEGDEVFVGRHSQCQILLNDPEVSRRHLKISKVGSEWYVDDLGSTNGTWVNGQRVTKQLLFLGDRIQIGQSVLSIRQRQLD